MNASFGMIMGSWLFFKESLFFRDICSNTCGRNNMMPGICFQIIWNEVGKGEDVDGKSLAVWL